MQKTKLIKAFNETKMLIMQFRQLLLNKKAQQITEYKYTLAKENQEKINTLRIEAEILRIDIQRLFREIVGCEEKKRKITEKRAKLIKTKEEIESLIQKEKQEKKDTLKTTISSIVINIEETAIEIDRLQNKSQKKTKERNELLNKLSENEFLINKEFQIQSDILEEEIAEIQIEIDTLVEAKRAIIQQLNKINEFAEIYQESEEKVERKEIDRESKIVVNIEKLYEAMPTYNNQLLREAIALEIDYLNRKRITAIEKQKIIEKPIIKLPNLTFKSYSEIITLALNKEGIAISNKVTWLIIPLKPNK
jgi:hypothetical protein